MSANKYLVTGLALSLTACATTARDKVYQNMLIAGAVGAIAGQQKEEYKTTYSTMYAASAAAIAGVVTLYIEDPEKESIKLRNDIKNLRTQLDQLSEPQVSNQVPATFGARVPDKYKAMINPGEWRIYEINQWVEEGENRLVHQDKIMELIPPSLKANSK